MGLSLDILIKLAILFFVVILFNKFIVPKIAEFLVKKRNRPKNSSASLDHMIRLKIGELSKDKLGYLSSSEGDKKKKSLDLKEDLINKYKEALETESNEKKLNDYNWALNLIEQLHWGDSQEIKDIQNYILQQNNDTLDITIITQKINQFLKSGVMAFGINKIITVSSLGDLIYLHYLLHESFSKKPPAFFQRLAVKNHSTINLINKATHCVIQKSRGYPIDKIYTNVVNNNSPLERVDQQKLDQIISDFCFIKGTDHPKEINTFIVELKKEITTLKAIYPIVGPQGKDDIEGALAVFNQTKKRFNLDKVKKEYKKMLAAAHPDRISNLDLAEDLNKVAHENFIKIQTSYEIIIKESKKIKSSA